MSNADGKPRPTHILAAGGLLMRQEPGRTLLAVVERNRYGTVTRAGDFSLPKGNVERGESITAAALREVLEETGCTARIVGPPDFCEYEVGGIPKVVAFFPMQFEREGPLRDAGEVRTVHWLPPEEARRRLSHAGERDVVTRVLMES